MFIYWTRLKWQKVDGLSEFVVLAVDWASYEKQFCKYSIKLQDIFIFFRSHRVPPTAIFTVTGAIP